MTYVKLCISHGYRLATGCAEDDFLGGSEDEWVLTAETEEDSEVVEKGSKDILGVDEPFKVNSFTGAQIKWALSQNNDDFGRIDYINFPNHKNTTLYLSRKNAGYRTDYAHKFTVTKGTAITVASVVLVGLFFGGTVVLSTVIAKALIAGVTQTITSGLTGYVMYKRYRWNYRVREGSQSGRLVTTTYRTKDFWIIEAEGKTYLQPATPGTNGGFRGTGRDILLATVKKFFS